MPSWFGQGSTGERSAILLTVLLVLSLACVTLYAREGEDGAIHAAQQAASGLLGPLKAVSGGVSATENSISNRLEDITADPNSLVALREQNQQLRETVAELEEFRQEAVRLEGLLQVKNTYNAQGISARILSRATDAWNRIVSIDAGTAEGVRAGLPVMSTAGLIGQVVSTTEHTADVRLIQDSQSGIAVIVQSNREEGILYGSLEGLLYLEDIEDDIEIQPGDVVLTSGLGGGYYRGIMVGTVLKVEGEAGAGSRKIIVEPTGSDKPYEEVYVVTSMTSPYEGELKDKNEEEKQSMIDLDGDGIPDEGTGYYQSYEDESYAYDEGYGYSEEEE